MSGLRQKTDFALDRTYPTQHVDHTLGSAERVATPFFSSCTAGLGSGSRSQNLGSTILVAVETRHAAVSGQYPPSQKDGTHGVVGVRVGGSAGPVLASSTLKIAVDHQSNILAITIPLRTCSRVASARLTAERSLAKHNKRRQPKTGHLCTAWLFVATPGLRHSPTSTRCTHQQQHFNRVHTSYCCTYMAYLL